ncbi:hypothetical protein [Streptomyces sp. NPDC002588]|uniref:hypothetical protein n=1 Tax=Streptomyces sp. NPDC002588 TaxID=3154419 RepID=UPI00331EEE05
MIPPYWSVPSSSRTSDWYQATTVAVVALPGDRVLEGGDGLETVRDVLDGVFHRLAGVGGGEAFGTVMFMLRKTGL